MSIFDIPGSVVRQAEDSRSFKLEVPPSARRHRKEPNTFFWVESGVITSAQSGTYKNEQVSPAQIVRTLEFTVDINAEGSGLNIGKPLTTTLRINHAALGSGEPKKQVTMSLMSIAKMKMLFQALGISPDMTDGGFSQELVERFFPKAESEFPVATSELIGQTIYFEVKQGPRELPDGSSKDSPEINKIIPETA